jgi:aminopeptidase
MADINVKSATRTQVVPFFGGRGKRIGSTYRTFEERLDKLAEVCVKIGLRVRPGQEVIVTLPLEAAPLLARIAAHAYAAGASLVTPFHTDDEVVLARFAHADNSTFDTGSKWLQRGIAEAFDSGAARLAITGADPNLLGACDPTKVNRVAKAAAIAARPTMDHITSFKINWNIVAFATRAWAKVVFPGCSERKAVSNLWDAIFAASRIDVSDPVAEWQAHNARLAARQAVMNAKGYSSLRFVGPGTDLTVGLADGHLWAGGEETAQNGITCNPNVPTEEVFTAPHRERVNGYVTSTKPLSMQGTLITGIFMRVKDGVIVEVRADQGEQVLREKIENEQGANRFGEVALVPHSSPISASGVLFFNTLFDENASCHIAFGKAYPTTIKNGANMTPAELEARGGNSSIAHVDFMIGSGEVDVFGILPDGTIEPVLAKGEFVV